MALQFRPVQRTNLRTAEIKYYANPLLTGKRTLDDISEDLAQMSSLTEGDVKNVISNFIHELPKWMMNGDSVKLDGFGTFRLSFSSDGVATQDEVSAELIKQIRIIFTPDVKIKEKIQHTKVNPVK